MIGSYEILEVDVAWIVAWIVVLIGVKIGVKIGASVGSYVGEATVGIQKAQNSDDN